MPFPVSRIEEDGTATGDMIEGPGAPTVLADEMPVSCMGDAVAGSVIEGVVAMGSPTVLIEGRPVTRTTSPVTGVNPETGVPVANVIATPGAMTVLVP
jgi:uncharacterized Zn-binding protein involved in type VI secretion